jgi:hypothetical protein
MNAPFLASRHEKWGVLFFRPKVYFVATDAAARIDYDGINAVSAVCASSPFLRARMLSEMRTPPIISAA